MYNGWTNWDTWNAALWLLNDDEMMYNDVARCETADQIRVYFSNVYGVKYDGINFHKVNWHEILETVQG